MKPFEIVVDPSIPSGTVLLVSTPSEEHARAMRGMTIEERARYMVEHRLATVGHFAPEESK